MLDDAFKALNTYDWGTDMAPLAPIEDAVAASHGQADTRQDLEKRLVASLASPISRDAKDYVCRKLAIIGTAAAVPVLAGLLVQKDESHMARFALERIPAAEAGQALRDALGKVSGVVKIGLISSVGARRDVDGVSGLGKLLKDSDPAVARAAALALGAIGNAEAAFALQEAASNGSSGNPSVCDGLLACAEALLAGKKHADALSIYKSLMGEQQPKLVRLAATRGMLACAGK